MFYRKTAQLFQMFCINSGIGSTKQMPKQMQLSKKVMQFFNLLKMLFVIIIFAIFYVKKKIFTEIVQAALTKKTKIKKNFMAPFYGWG